MKEDLASAPRSYRFDAPVVLPVIETLSFRVALPSRLMAPKGTAAPAIFQASGSRAATGRLEDGADLLDGHAGTPDWLKCETA